MSGHDLFKDTENVFREVCKTFNKTENEVNQDIESIKTWLQKQHHLPEMMKDSHIRNFLILNKFNLDKTKQKIEMYYTIRTLIPDFFDNCNPKLPNMREIFNHGDGGLHPKLLNGLHRVYMVNIFGPDSRFFPKEAILTVWNSAEVRLHEDCIFYDIYVLDLRNFSFSEVFKITPSIVIKALTIYEVFSLRAKAVYLVNAPPYISKAMALLKTILKPKIFNRIHVYESDKILKEIFPVDDLPKDYGGNGPSIQEMTVLFRNKLDEYQSRFDELDNMRVNESLRPKNLDNDDILGFHGNFRKLSVD